MARPGSAGGGGGLAGNVGASGGALARPSSASGSNRRRSSSVKHLKSSQANLAGNATSMEKIAGGGVLGASMGSKRGSRMLDAVTAAELAASRNSINGGHLDVHGDVPSSDPSQHSDEPPISASQQLHQQQQALEEAARKEEEERRRVVAAMFEAKIAALPLPVDILRAGLSCLGPCPDPSQGGRHVYLKLSLPNMGLANIEMLRKYIYIQNLELPGNSITVQLDLSNNRLTKTLGDDILNPPPYNLQQVDLSRNQIVNMGDWSAHSLVNNGITRIEGLEGLPLIALDLRSNRIRSLQGLETLYNLEELYLSHNAIQNFAHFNPESHKDSLRVLDLTANLIDDPYSITILKDCVMLRELMLRKNPLVVGARRKMPPQSPALPPSRFWDTLAMGKSKHEQGLMSIVNGPAGRGNGGLAMHAYQKPSKITPTPPGTMHAQNAQNDIIIYRLWIAFSLPHLTVLDGLPLSPKEKVAALNRYDPPPQVIASVQHAVMLTKQIKLYAKIRAVDLLRCNKLRPIVLCGSNGAGKREEMEEMIENGRFVEIVTLFGNMYGTSLDAIDKVTEEGKVCILHLQMEGVLALKRSHLRPRYVHIKVTSPETLEQRVRQRLKSAGGGREAEVGKQVEGANTTVSQFDLRLSQTVKGPPTPGVDPKVEVTINQQNKSISVSGERRSVHAVEGANTLSDVGVARNNVGIAMPPATPQLNPLLPGRFSVGTRPATQITPEDNGGRLQNSEVQQRPRSSTTSTARLEIPASDQLQEDTSDLETALVNVHLTGTKNGDNAAGGGTGTAVRVAETHDQDNSRQVGNPEQTLLVQFNENRAMQDDVMLFGSLRNQNASDATMRGDGDEPNLSVNDNLDQAYMELKKVCLRWYEEGQREEE
ncbi:hypothetical protein HK102_009892 [Quaeritorhiza haematococci]|nr:hypothetical protein HK102_009892 [Quaeritorhiza haematococci]